jgi:uncharacterized protein with NAD-binding domain and iron-sulfur cluster
VPDAKNPARVVIVGGGCAGMAAAWELAKQRGYDIHVYEKTPRLGGKGSSTRGGDGRIYEHGLHVWMGWYENAFRMMRECYGVVKDNGWGPDSKDRRLAHGCFEDAFMPEPNVGLVDPEFHGEKVMWSVLFPPNEGQPGTPMTPQDNPFTMAAYMTRSMELVRALVLSMVDDIPGRTPGPPRPDHRSRSDEILSLDIQTPAADSTAALLNRIAEISRAGALTGAAALLQFITMLEVWLRRQNIGPKAPESTLAIAEAAVSQVRKVLRDVVGVDPKLRMKTEVIDIVLTIMIGLFNDRVMFRKDGLDSLNDYDYRQWLEFHGATKTSLESRFIRAAYDFAFAYVDGDLRKPRLAAGVAIRGGFRMFFTYRGAAFWRMCSGMGDAVFAPLYAVLEHWREKHPQATLIQEEAAEDAVLKAEGKTYEDEPPRLRSPVTFHFSHELTKACFDEGGLSLAQLVFHSDAAQDGALENAPQDIALEESGGWPKRPDFDPPAKEPTPDPPAKREVARKRRDDLNKGLEPGEFDYAIIAAGIPDFAKVFVKPFDKKSRQEEPDAAVLKAWTVTSDATKTVATKSAQVWLDKDLYDLGWRRGSGLFTCMAQETFDTYADMTHVLPAEGRAAKWRSLAYFCNPMEDRLPAKAYKAFKARVREELGGDTRETAEGEKAFKERLDAELDRQLPYELWESVRRDLANLVTDQMDAFWPDLFDPEKTEREERAATWRAWVKERSKADEYYRANLNGSERYTLSLPGSIASRVSPLDDGIDNMTVAGDWTACGLDCGCVEAAVISGMLAAASISGKPAISDIVGYDQP